MKKSTLFGLVLCLAGAACTRPQPAAVQNETPITQVAPSPSPSPAVPVQLAGLVNNMGVKDFSGVGANIAVEFQIKDFSFTPTFIKVLPGTNVNVQLDNLGQAEHTFTIDSLKVDHKLAPGGQVEGQFMLPESGVIPFYCRFHVGQGMQGAFYFEEGGAAVSASPTPESDDSAGTSSSSGTKKKSATSSRASSAAKAPAASAQNREGDLVVPDLVIGEAQAGKSTATTLPKALPTSPRSSPRPGVTTPPKVTAGKPAAAGAPGKPSEAGKAGEAGEEGTPGEPGDTDSSNTN